MREGQGECEVANLDDLRCVSATVDLHVPETALNFEVGNHSIVEANWSAELHCTACMAVSTSSPKIVLKATAKRRLRNGSSIYCFIRSVIQWRHKPGSHLCRPTSPSAPTFYLLQQCDQHGNSDWRKERRVDRILVLVRLWYRSQPVQR